MQLGLTEHIIYILPSRRINQLFSSDFTNNGSKCYPLVHIGESVLESTHMAINMMENGNNRIKIWLF